MNLTFTPEQCTFREQVRTWLAQNKPSKKLKSYDTKEGFEDIALGKKCYTKRDILW